MVYTSVQGKWKMVTSEWRRAFYSALSFHLPFMIKHLPFFQGKKND